MARKIAACCSLLVFAVSILLGLQAENSFSTTLSRALLAMAATFAVGLVIGTMAQKMSEEKSARDLSGAKKKIEESPAEIGANDR
jgi:predicted MFS family arabinose efflux permease